MRTTLFERAAGLVYNMSKRQTIKVAWRAIRANHDKMEMAKVKHLGVMNSKNNLHLFY